MGTRDDALDALSVLAAYVSGVLPMSSCVPSVLQLPRRLQGRGPSLAISRLVSLH